MKFSDVDGTLSAGSLNVQYLDTMSCAEAVFKYMVAQNRPYSATDVTMNLGNQHSKGSVQKALEQLAQQGRILEKEYGKQKVYCALQTGGATKESLAKELQELDAGIAATTQNLNAVDQQVGGNSNLRHVSAPVGLVSSF